MIWDRLTTSFDRLRARRSEPAGATEAPVELDECVVAALGRAGPSPRRKREGVESFCEIQIEDGEWRRVTVQEALDLRAMNPRAAARCPACFGRLSLHRQSKSGAKPHAEHRDRGSPCLESRRRRTP